MTRHEVRLTLDAERDLEEILSFVALREGLVRAGAVLAQFERALSELRAFPGRAPPPPELRDTGLIEFKQVHVKPWRIVFRVDGRVVHVMLIADGRRDLRRLLTRRLVDPPKP